jgi:hypothetical protein
MQEFDINRAQLSDKDSFQPFRVKSTRPLADACAEGDVRDDTPLLVLEREGGILALLTEQMNYHHMAQGELAGEPWLVTF